MNFIETHIPGCWIIEPVRHGDDRGYFQECFRLKDFEAHIPGVKFVQDNESFSTRGVLRGMHLQKGDAAQSKLVRVSQGAVYDCAVDLRPGSETFGQHVIVELSAANGRQLFIPKGFAHGFIVVSDVAQFQYKVDNYYVPASEMSIRYDDPDLGISWPDAGCPVLLSPKDVAGLSFAEAREIILKGF